MANREDFATAVGGLIKGRSPVGHTHDDRYYTEAETTTLVDGAKWYRGTINSGDLNTYQDPANSGVWRVTALVANMPTTNVGILELLPMSSSTVQRYTAWGTLETWQRRWASGTWGAWQKNAKISDITDAQPWYRGPISSGSLDDYTSPAAAGVYDTTAVVAGMPENIIGTLEVLPLGSSTIHRYTTWQPVPRTFIRRYSGGWNAWTEQGAGGSTVPLVVADVPYTPGAISPANADTGHLAIWGSSSAERSHLVWQGIAASWGATLTEGGKGAERVEHIAARLGSTPALLAPVGGAIPATGPVTVTCANVPASASWMPYAATLAGVHGTVSSTASTVTFTRTTPGTTVTVSDAQPAIPEAGEAARDAVTMLWMGKNNVGSTGADQIVTSETDKAHDWLAPFAKKVLVLGHFVDTGQAPGLTHWTNVHAINRAHAARYGAAFVDVQAYVTSPAIWADTGLTPTQADLDEQASGYKPPSLSADSGHLNATGYTAVANLARDRMLTLGWYGGNTPYDSGAYSITSLAGGNVASGEIILRRHGQVVTLSLEKLKPSSTYASGSTMLTIPAGFRRSRRWDGYIQGGTSVFRSAFLFPGGDFGIWAPATTDDYRAEFTWITDDPVPA